LTLYSPRSRISEQGVAANAAGIPVSGFNVNPPAPLLA